MDAPRIGRTLRVLRVRRGWRQRDLADAAKVARGRLVLVENGRARELTLGELCEIFEALDASVDVVVRWRGEGADRLLDAGHAALVEEVVRRLRLAGWTPVVEASYNVFGERGSIDVLAWHPGHRILLVVEVKTFITDTQALLWSLDRKARLAPTIARDRGWALLAVGRLLVAGEGRTNRRRIAEHGAVFASTFPGRGAAVRAWLRHPRPEPFAGMVLLRVPAAEQAMRRRVRPRRATRSPATPPAPSA